MTNDFQVQTRDFRGGLCYFSTLKEAEDFALKNDVWKISFSLPSGERIRLVVNDNYRFEMENIRTSLFDDVPNTKSNLHYYFDEEGSVQEDF